MKAAILPGDLRRRINEESHLRPTPMIEIGGKPILCHIMRMYARYGIAELVICQGYRAMLAKQGIPK